MSTGLITELMFNALDSLPVILFTVFHQPLVPVPCFLFSLRSAGTWLLRVSSFIIACRSAFTSQYFLVFLFLTDPDGTQVFNQWRHTRGSHEDTFIRWISLWGRYPISESPWWYRHKTVSCSKRLCLAYAPFESSDVPISEIHNRPVRSNSDARSDHNN